MQRRRVVEERRWPVIITQTVRITPEAVWLNGTPVPVTRQGNALLTDIYRNLIGDYPKFFKMDTLSRLGFVASELLLQAEGNRFGNSEDRAVVLFNKSASLCTDRHYQASIAKDVYYPSPATFVYTLANIVTGEIAIRNKYYGETSFYVVDSLQSEILCETVKETIIGGNARSALCGWLECETDDRFEAILFIVDSREEKDAPAWTKDMLRQLIEQ